MEDSDKMQVEGRTVVQAFSMHSPDHIKSTLRSSGRQGPARPKRALEAFNWLMIYSVYEGGGNYPSYL